MIIIFTLILTSLGDISVICLPLNTNSGQMHLAPLLQRKCIDFLKTKNPIIEK